MMEETQAIILQRCCTNNDESQPLMCVCRQNVSQKNANFFKRKRKKKSHPVHILYTMCDPCDILSSQRFQTGEEWGIMG